MLQVLLHTPTWVYGLFVFLLLLGLFLSRERTVGMSRAFILSCGMFGWTLVSTLLMFEGRPLAVFCWAVALGMVRLYNLRLALPRGVAYLPETRRFHFSGGYSILALIMAVFFVRYAVAAATAIHPELKHDAAFMVVTSAVFGLFSGIFFVRAMSMLRAVRTSSKPAV